MNEKKGRRVTAPTDTPYYHISAPDEYDPKEFGVSDEQSAQITRLRRLFAEGRYRDLLGEQATSDIAGAVLNLYQAMSILQMPAEEPGGGDRLCVLGHLASALHILNSLPSDMQVDYCRRLRVNIGVHIASALKALSNDTYYPLALVTASMDLASDPRMGNWTAYATTAEYEYDHGVKSGLASDAINEKVFEALMKAAGASVKFDTTKMERYVDTTVHFEDFRKSPLYAVFKESLNKVKA
jgi:hypothetical protein